MVFHRKLWILSTLVIILMVIGCTNQQQTASKPLSPDVTKKLELLNKAADELYQKSNAGDFPEARIKAQDIGHMVTTISFQGVTTAAGVKALVDTIIEAEKALNAVKLQPDNVLIVTAKLRLATDSLTHRNEPMWHQYDQVLKEDLQDLEAAGQQQNQKSALAAFAAFEQHYAMIRPSLLLNRDPSQAEKGDSFVTFMKTELQAKEIRYHQIVNGTKQFLEHLNELFGLKRDDKTAYLPIAGGETPIIWTLLFGLFIMAVLSFAAWRMYPVKSGFSRVNRRNDFK